LVTKLKLATKILTTKELVSKLVFNVNGVEQHYMFDS